MKITCSKCGDLRGVWDFGPCPKCGEVKQTIDATMDKIRIPMTIKVKERP